MDVNQFSYEERQRLTAEWAEDKEYQKWRSDQATQKRTQRIREQLPGILEGNAMVWCRNGAVCREATPCGALLCKYKKGNLDIVNGTSECQSFQITKKSADWYHAEMICEAGDVIPWGGW